MENPNLTTTNKVSCAVKADGVQVTPPVDSSKKEADDSKVTDVQKKIRRAERFGISVQLSEQEKRNSRAQRFGTGPTLKSEEELKRKARAERFGLPVTADDEAKKKARLHRFAPSSKKNVLDEDKMKATDMRHSQPLSSSLSMNGKGNVETKAAITGKAGSGS